MYESYIYGKFSTYQDIIEKTWKIPSIFSIYPSFRVNVFHKHPISDLK